MSEAIAASAQDAPQKWWVQVKGQAYGPYTPQQIADYLKEGRIRPATKVSDNPERGWVEARAAQALRVPANDQTGRAHAEAANMFVFAEIHSGAWNAFMAALEHIGFVCELAPGLWLVRTRHTSGVVRNTLSQTLQMGDRFVVIDASRDRFAWFNLGPEIDVRIKEVWNGPLKPERAR